MRIYVIADISLLRLFPPTRHIILWEYDDVLNGVSGEIKRNRSNTFGVVGVKEMVEEEEVYERESVAGD